MSLMQETVDKLFEGVSGDVPSIRADARGSTPLAKAGAIGAGSAIIPVAGYLTMPADLVALMRIMHRSAIGICEITMGYAWTMTRLLASWLYGLDQ